MGGNCRAGWAGGWVWAAREGRRDEGCDGTFRPAGKSSFRAGVMYASGIGGACAGGILICRLTFRSLAGLFPLTSERGMATSGTEADRVANWGFSDRGINGGEAWSPSSEDTDDLWLITGEAADGEAAAEDMEDTDEMEGLWNCGGGLEGRFMGGGLPRWGEGVLLEYT